MMLLVCTKIIENKIIVEIQTENMKNRDERKNNQEKMKWKTRKKNQEEKFLKTR